MVLMEVRERALRVVPALLALEYSKIYILRIISLTSWCLIFHTLILIVGCIPIFRRGFGCVFHFKAKDSQRV